MHRAALPVLAATLAVVLGACAGDAPLPSALEDLPSVTADDLGADAIIVAAGDIAGCTYRSDSATAALVAAHPDATVAALGDLVYPHGADRYYQKCYDPVWGGFMDRTRPAIGNHDAEEDDGDAFFAHFDDAAGESGQGWYSYDLEGWHVVVLNSNCELVGCAPGSDQHEWLMADLAASEARCTLAYWHHPRFSSGPHGNDPLVGPFWEALYADGAEIVLAGHDHLYERFAPQAPDGAPDPERGIRQFTAGTGGKDLYELEELQPNSEHLELGAHGILRLTLSGDGYAWSFLTTDGREVDAGQGTCH